MAIANGKDKNRSGVDLGRLDRFIKRISGIRETPVLMQIIAGSGEWMEFTRKLASVVPTDEGGLWREFHRACRRRNLDPEQLKARLVPVVRSLGLWAHGNQQQDYYSLLGVDPAASTDDIRKAYHRRAKSLHPDTSKTDGDNQAFIQLADGYRVLEDPVLRAHYDQSRQSMGVWCEGAACLDESEDRPDRISKRNRYILQFSGLIILMLIVGFIVSVVYESRSLDDGYYPTPAPIKAVSNKDEKETFAYQNGGESVEKRQKTDQTNGWLKGDETDGESVGSDAAERTPEVSSMHVENRPDRIAEENTDPKRKQMNSTGPIVSIKKNDRFVEDGTDFGVTDQKNIAKAADIKSHESVENALKVKKTEFFPPVKTGSEMKVDEKPIGKKRPHLSVEKRTQDDPNLNGHKMDLEADQKTALAMIRNFVREDDEVNRISGFIKKYTEIYEERDYSKFSRLFTEDATENGTLFSDLAHDYRRTFATKEELKFDIKLRRTSLLVDQAVIRAEGTYRITWRPDSGAGKEYEGFISFELVKGEGGYLVKKLEYH